MTGFTKLGIAERGSDLLHTLGIKDPTPVQAQTIPVVLTGKDVISQAQTGTGKTLAFVLPMLERIKPEVPYLQGLIVTPTRELAIQITAEVKKLLPAYEGIRVLPVYGGQDVEAQLHKLQGHVHLIVATPGRLLDHMRRETVRLTNVRQLVLDEADQMLHMGFLSEVEEIMSKTPNDRQTMLFSATMPDKIRNLANRYLRNPEEVTVRAKQVTVKDTAQLVIETTDRAKQAALVTMIGETQPYLGIIFCRTKRRASTLNEALQEMGYSCDELHGDLSQSKREQVMRTFRDAKLQLLVATDIAARGLDVEGVTHVFNYDIPHDVESYIHRIGRTGRAGGAGMAITFASPRDLPELGVIEDGIGMSIERRTIGESGSVSIAKTVPARARTAGAFGNRSGSRGAAGGTRGGRAGGDRGGRGVKSERTIGDRGASRFSGERGAGRDEARGQAGRGGAAGFGGSRGSDAGRSNPAARGRADNGASAASAETGKWWEKGKYFTPEPEEQVARVPARRPGAGGPGNGRRGDVAVPQKAQTSGQGGRPGAGAEQRGDSRYGNAGGKSGSYSSSERGAKSYGDAAERPKRGSGAEYTGGRAGRPGNGGRGKGSGSAGGSSYGGFGGGSSFGGRSGGAGGGNRSGGAPGGRGGKPPARGGGSRGGRGK